MSFGSHFSFFLLFSSWFSWFFLLGLVLFAIFIFRVFCICVCLPCQCGAIYVLHKRISAAVVIKMEHPPPHAVPSDPSRHRHAGRRWATTPRQVPPPLAAALLARHPGAPSRRRDVIRVGVMAPTWVRVKLKRPLARHC